MESTVAADSQSLEARVQFLERRCSHLKQWLCVAWIVGICFIIQVWIGHFRPEPVIQANVGEFHQVSAEMVQLKSQSGDFNFLRVGKDGQLKIFQKEKQERKDGQPNQ